MIYQSSNKDLIVFAVLMLFPKDLILEESDEISELTDTLQSLLFPWQKGCEIRKP